MLNIEVEGDSKFRTDIQYQGNLSYKSKNIEVYDSSIIVNDGMLTLSAEEGLKMV